MTGVDIAAAIVRFLAGEPRGVSPGLSRRRQSHDLYRAETLGLYAQLACVWEATARKPGNVHRFHDFADVTYLDFLASAAAIGPVFDAVATTTLNPEDNYGVGEIVLRGVQQTRKVTNTNTNLGILLLLAPLARVSRAIDMPAAIVQVLKNLQVRDANFVYQAIRLANPSGLGHVQEQDVSQLPTQTLLQVMTLAADRDLIARQYTNGFQDVFLAGVPILKRGLEESQSLENAIIGCHLHLLARYPDSLIAQMRSCSGGGSEPSRCQCPRGPAGPTAPPAGTPSPN